jgi:hypothetical protein
MKIELAQRTVESVLPRLCDALDQYLWLQRELRRRNVFLSRDYQKAFNRFYRVRRGTDWQRVFYRLLESAKSKSMTFPVVLRRLYKEQRRVEASFASKLVATIDPELPVIDSRVLENLDVRLSSAGSVDSRIERISELHAEMATAFASYLRTSKGRWLVAGFRAKYPDAAVTETKMLDLVLWKTRSVARRADPSVMRRRGL